MANIFDTDSSFFAKKPLPYPWLSSSFNFFQLQKVQFDFI